MLVGKNLQKSYNQVQVLKGVNLELKAGEVVALIGASGAGKTTLLQILGLLDKADAGEIWFGNELLTQLNEKKKPSGEIKN